MNGWTIAALLGGLVAGYFLAVHCLKVGLLFYLDKGVNRFTLGGITYIVTPMKKEGEHVED
jgi:hypothetical protein